MHTRSDGASFEQRFLTTSFLPSLQDLRDRATCIYIVATNNFEDLDPAARAPRRFDFQLGVLPPAFDEKMRLIESEFSGKVPPAVARAIDERREQIAWATVSEMAAVTKRLAASPTEAKQTLAQFHPVLFEDRTKWEKEVQQNAFHKGA